MPQGGRSESLYAATATTFPKEHQDDLRETPQSEALTSLLIHARRAITYQPQLTLEYPAGEMTESDQWGRFQGTPHVIVDAGLIDGVMLTHNATGMNDFRIKG